jgi:hypothetical protein
MNYKQAIFSHGVFPILYAKPYRNLFLESLPDCKKMEGRMEDLPAAAKRWLNL